MIANLLLLMQSGQWLMGLECLLSGAVRLVFCVHHLHIMYVILALTMLIEPLALNGVLSGMSICDAVILSEWFVL